MAGRSHKGETAMRAFALIVLTAAFTVAAAGGERTANAGSIIVFDETSHDFGVVTQRAALHHTFKFYNAGDGVLKIQRVHASCACTVAQLTGKEIQPGGMGEIEVTFESRDYEGTVVRHIRVFTNDPENKCVTLSVSANVLPDIACSPSHLDFRATPEGEAAELAVKVFSPSKKEFAIESVETSADFLKATFEKDAEENHYVVRVKLEVAPDAGAFTGSIAIKTNLEEAPVIKVPVSGSVRARTEVMPQKLFFGMVKGGGRPSREINIRANSWDGLEAKRVETPDNMTATVKEVDKGKHWVITVQIGDAVPPGILKEQITIVLNDPHKRVVAVPVRGLVRTDE